MKDIKGYEGLYAVTSCGKVWSYRSKKFLKAYESGGGYLKVSLQGTDGGRKQVYVHRLVAEAFVPNPEGKGYVNHLDENKKNNVPSNLTWVSQQENVIYSMVAKPKIFSQIRCVETGEVFNSCVDAAAWAGVHRYAINSAVNGKAKTSAGYHWERVLQNEKEISQSK